MTEPAPINLQIQTADCERASVITCARFLTNILTQVSGDDGWTLNLRFQPADEALVAAPDATAIILSLLPETARQDESIAATHARWRAKIEPLLASGLPIFVITIFRHVRDRARDGGPNPLLERIRRLNRMAADLSHELGVSVIDIDRACAHIGARTMNTDWQLGGELAARVAGHTMAKSLISLGLDDAIDPAIQEKVSKVLHALVMTNQWPHTLALPQSRVAAGA